MSDEKLGSLVDTSLNRSDTVDEVEKIKARMEQVERVYAIPEMMRDLRYLIAEVERLNTLREES